eukprot:scaffold27568_cov129-Isochrysis_galbana.AAC.1
MKQAGYRVYMCIVSASYETCLRRVAEREVCLHAASSPTHQPLLPPLPSSLPRPRPIQPLRGNASPSFVSGGLGRVLVLCPAGWGEGMEHCQDTFWREPPDQLTHDSGLCRASTHSLTSPRSPSIPLSLMPWTARAQVATGRGVPPKFIKLAMEGMAAAVPVYLSQQALICDALAFYDNEVDSGQVRRRRNTQSRLLVVGVGAWPSDH